MKAAIAHNQRPSVLVLGKDSGKKWGKWDTLLAKAYQRFLSELCQQCGMPKYICHSDDNRIQFKLSRDECASTAMSERELDRMRQQAEKNPNQRSFGVRVFGEPFLAPQAIEDGLELSDFRKPYLTEEAKKLGLIPNE
jgi:hypothetical protein